MTTLGYALLGLLARRALSGYDLAREMKRPVGYFWQARHSQIYPQLARLEALGLVAHGWWRSTTGRTRRCTRSPGPAGRRCGTGSPPS